MGFSSVQSQLSDSLQPHGLQQARPPCPLPTSRVYSNLCPLSWWCHPTSSSSVISFSSCLQSFPASGSFQMSQLFTSGDQSIGVSTSTYQHDGIRALLRRGSSISLISYLCLSQSLCLSLPGKSIWSHSQDAGKTIWAHSKNEAVCMPGHGSSPGAKCTGTLTLDILVSTAVRNKMFKLPSLVFCYCCWSWQRHSLSTVSKLCVPSVLITVTL